MSADQREFSIDGESSPRYKFSGGVIRGTLSLQIDHHYGTRVLGFGCSFEWTEVLKGKRCARSITLTRDLTYQVTIKLVDKRALRLEIKIKAPDGSEDRCVTPIRQIVQL